MPDPPGPAPEPPDDGAGVGPCLLDPHVPTVGVAGAVPDAVEPALDVAQWSLHGLRIPRKGAGGMAGREAEHDDDEQRGSAGANHRLGSWVFGSAEVAG